MQVEADEFKRVVLELYECLKQGAMTPMMERIVEQYRKEVENLDDTKKERGN